MADTSHHPEGSTPRFIDTAPDSPLARDFARRYYHELDQRFPSGFQLDTSVGISDHEITPPHGVLLVGYLDTQPFGCGAVRRGGGVEAEIKRMWIDPSFRGLGLGRSLLLALEDRAKELGAEAIYLDTSVYLTEAIALYQAHGYREVPPYNANRYAGLWFSKPLSPRGPSPHI